MHQTLTTPPIASQETKETAFAAEALHYSRFDWLGIAADHRFGRR